MLYKLIKLVHINLIKMFKRHIIKVKVRVLMIDKALYIIVIKKLKNQIKVISVLISQRKIKSSLFNNKFYK